MVKQKQTQELPVLFYLNEKLFLLREKTPENSVVKRKKCSTILSSYFYTMDITSDNWKKKSSENQKEYKRLLQRADKNKALKLLPELHEEAFSEINCLDCAACCKNYSPRFKTPDIKRIARHIKMKESVFIDTYLYLDEDGDYVVKSKPCPFLGEDNHCSIYDARPSDCARFPYTDEDVLLKRPQITLKNSTFCPAVFFVLEKLRGITSMP